MVESNPAYNNNSVDRIISKEKEREDIQGEILQGPHSSSNLRVFQCFHMQSSHPMLGNYSTYRINSISTKLQEILQL